MADFSTLSYPGFFSNNSDLSSISSFGRASTEEPNLDVKPVIVANEPPPPPPIVICPTEVDNINITLEKNQQCSCKDCGKLFNSVWYLKQHAVKHSNDRPFKCKWCYKTYKFRSNLYQHKCPERQKNMAQQGRRGVMNMQPSARRMETNQLLKSRIEANMTAEELAAYQSGSQSDNEENDIPITYGLLIHKINEQPQHKEATPPPPPPRLPSPPLVDTHRPITNCIREHQLPDHEIESYITLNKSKLHTCRKCRLLFPTAASLMRHSAAHSRDDKFPYRCTNCRQAFETEKDLGRHAVVHANIGPWKCEKCKGFFRSGPALRRHQDQSRPCLVENSDMIPTSSPLDPFSFIPSESDLLYNSNDFSKKSPDSGVGSEASPPYHSSPERTSTIDDLFDSCGQKKKDDDEDSGFRSRLNSVTQTCSPGSSSAFSSDGGSPQRKMSGVDVDSSGFSMKHWLHPKMSETASFH